MIRIKYVGVKDRETAFSDVTGIVWLPGSAHEVDDKMAQTMLGHPDVFALAESSGKTADAAADAGPSLADAKPAGDATVDPSTMDPDAARAWLKAKGVEFHARLGLDKLRALVAEHLKA